MKFKTVTIEMPEAQVDWLIKLLKDRALGKRGNETRTAIEWMVDDLEIAKKESRPN